MGITGLPFGQGGGVLCGWEADNSRGLTLRGVEVGRRPTTQWRRPTAMFYKAPPGEALGAPWDSLATSWRKNDRLNPSPSIRGAAHFCEVVRIDAPKHF